MKRSKRKLILTAILLITCFCTSVAQNDENGLEIDNWLKAGPVSLPLPVFHDVENLKGEVFSLKELLLFGPTPGITDEGMKHVAEMTSLTLLSLDRAKVTDEGLIHLAHLVNLQELELTETQVTDAGVGRLRRALPKCTVSVR